MAESAIGISKVPHNTSLGASSCVSRYVPAWVCDEFGFLGSDEAAAK